MLCFSYYCLYSLFSIIRDRGRTVSAWKEGGRGERRGREVRGRNGPNNVWTYE
jgi:hypothetical protein